MRGSYRGRREKQTHVDADNLFMSGSNDLDSTVVLLRVELLELLLLLPLCVRNGTRGVSYSSEEREGGIEDEHRW